MKKFLLVLSILSFSIISIDAMESGDNYTRLRKDREDQRRKLTLSGNRDIFRAFSKKAQSARDLLQSPRKELSPRKKDRITRNSSNDSSTSPRASNFRVSFKERPIVACSHELPNDHKNSLEAREGSLLYDFCPGVLKKVSSKERLIQDGSAVGVSKVKWLEEDIRHLLIEEKNYQEKITTLQKALEKEQEKNAALEKKCALLQTIANQYPPRPATGREGEREEKEKDPKEISIEYRDAISRTLKLLERDILNNKERTESVSSGVPDELQELPLDRQPTSKLPKNLRIDFAT